MCSNKLPPVFRVRHRDQVYAEKQFLTRGKALLLFSHRDFSLFDALLQIKSATS